MNNECKIKNLIDFDLYKKCSGITYGEYLEKLKDTERIIQVKNMYDILTQAKATFPTVKDAQRKAKKRWPKRDFHLDTITTKNRHFLQQYLLLLVSDWFLEWLGGREK